MVRLLLFLTDNPNRRTIGIEILREEEVTIEEEISKETETILRIDH